MDHAGLRDLIRPLVLALKDAGTHATLPDLCQQIGLPAPPGANERTKSERLAASLSSLPDEELPSVAERLIAAHPPVASVRNEIQDAIWAAGGYPVIQKRTRHEVARTLDPEDLYLDAGQFDELLERLGLPGSDVPGWLDVRGSSLRAEIERHVHRNPGDWSVEELFRRIEAFDCSDRRFALLLEGLVSADVRPDEKDQRRLVGILNEGLRRCGATLREVDNDGGYPVFRLVSTRSGVHGRPKNLVFASPEKPDIRILDAVNNDIEIVTNAERVLVYDRPLGSDPLLWRDLQAWWSEVRQIPDQERAKKTLYRRLQASLPRNSPPQRALFDGFYGGYGRAVPELPALLPEVWLHWDPKTVRERGPDALLRFRMDFLLLLPGGVRVVVEVDGKHHYADEAGRADVNRYGAMMAADRDLRLSGYEVFRFGAAELLGPEARGVVKRFFDGLFRTHGIQVPNPRT